MLDEILQSLGSRLGGALYLLPHALQPSLHGREFLAAWGRGKVAGRQPMVRAVWSSGQCGSTEWKLLLHQRLQHASCPCWREACRNHQLSTAARRSSLRLEPCRSIQLPRPHLSHTCRCHSSWSAGSAASTASFCSSTRWCTSWIGPAKQQQREPGQHSMSTRQTLHHNSKPYPGHSRCTRKAAPSSFCSR